jgi:hypothetical protein
MRFGHCKQIVVGLGFILLGAGVLLGNSIQAAGPSVMIVSVENDVQIKKPPSTTWQSAMVNMTLSAGDSIKTGNNSYATLKFSYPKENCLQLYENTEVTVAELIKGRDGGLKEVGVNMLKGGTWSKLVGAKGKDLKFRLQTPNTVAAISGTSLAVIVYSKDEAYFCACDGMIQIGTPGKSVTLKRAEGTTVMGDAAPVKPASDKHIIMEEKYKKDPRYAWCIHCHSRLGGTCGPAAEQKVDVFPGCGKKAGGK